MRFVDLLKLSFHSIYYNKIRTLITIIIIFVVSLLIMAISIIGLSFYQSMNNAYIDLFDKMGARFEMQSYYSSSRDGNYEGRGINLEEYTYMMQEFSQYPELVDNVVINSNMESFYLYDLDEKPNKQELKNLYDNYLYGKYYNARTDLSIISSYGNLDIKSKGISYLKSGRLWSKEDEGTKQIWVSEAFISNAASIGQYIDVGDYVTITLKNWIQDKDGNHTEVYGAERLKVAGVFLNSSLEELGIYQDTFIDIVTAYNIVENDINIYNIYITSEPKVSYIFNQEYKKMTTIVNNVNDHITPSRYDKTTQERFRCDLVDSLKMSKVIGLVINGACVFICFIILLISIGSVANSVIISVDKNKKFFGVMMAVGLRGNGVKRIVQFESLFMIMVSTGLAYGILRLLGRFFIPIIDFLMTMPGFTDSSIVAMPPFIPIATITAFILMALLFSRKSLSRIINMDVISVISEVN